jgi:hypothetical protein
MTAKTSAIATPKTSLWLCDSLSRDELENSFISVLPDSSFSTESEHISIDSFLNTT